MLNTGSDVIATTMATTQQGLSASVPGSVPGAVGSPPSGRSLADLALWSGRDLGWEELVDDARRIGPDPALATMSDQQLERDMCGVASQLAALTARWLELLSEFVVRGVWADQGARTPAEWLSWKVGVAPSTAREHVRIALRLRELPRVRAAFQAGTLSYSKVRAMTRIAVPEIEDLVLQWADVSTAAQLERISADLRASQRASRADRAAQEQDNRSEYGWRTRSNLDGTMTITMICPVEEGAELCEALERRVDAAASSVTATDDDQAPVDADVSDNDWPPPDSRGAPASAADLIEQLLATVLQADPDRASDTTGLDRHTLVLHAALEDLQAVDEGDPDEGCEQQHGPDRDTGHGRPPDHGRDTVVAQDSHRRVHVLRRGVLRRLACEAGVVLAAVDADGTPIDLGRRERRPNTALRRAVHLRDRGCTFPGCAATRHLHVHHVQHWADGGSTDLSNLVLICGHHHRFVHQHRWDIEVERNGQHRYSPPGGTALERSPKLARSACPVGEDRSPDVLQPSFVDVLRRSDRDVVIQVLRQEVARAAPDLSAAA